MGWKTRPDCPPDEVVVLRPLRAMREKCLDCCCGQHGQVRECPCTGCTLWPYRFGKRPGGAKRTGKPLTDEQKRKLQEGRARARAERRAASCEESAGR